ncbi:Imm1 family immunity protein [Kutzneria sp. CA-103260]|uniref:Imm1 family immunity protein n=1 Tax=Kutzneria sp. CA-103260 TaxID=2802641 RepID=UPI003FA5F132
MIVTALLTTGVARVSRGLTESHALIEEILCLDHADWESTMAVGDVEFHTSKEGPFPNSQMRVSVSPSAGYAALNYMDHDDPDHPVVNSFNPIRPLPEVFLIFNGSTGAIFPRTAAIPISDARNALIEWLDTRSRPTCIQWRPYDRY